MNTAEFSTEFDIMYNNITSNQAPGLNGYEKSVFLTQAQSQLVVEWFNSLIDRANGGFDGSRKRQYDFSSLITHTVLDEIDSQDKFDQRAKLYKFPDDWFLTLNEQLSVNYGNIGKYLTVKPLSIKEYDRLMSKPYKYPSRDEAWRIITKSSMSTSQTVDVFEPYSFARKWNLSGEVIDGITHTNVSLTFKDASEGSWGYEFVCDDGVDYEFGTMPSPLYDNVILCHPDYPVSKIIADTLNGTGRNLTDMSIIGTSDFTPHNYGIAQGDTFMSIYSPGASKTQQTVPGPTITGTIVELITRYDDSIEYRLRYVKKPLPIILENLAPYSVSIDGETQVHECVLPKISHREILERAVMLAKLKWMANTQTSSESNKERSGNND